MDKKTSIILGVIAAVIVVLVAAVFVMDSKTVNYDKNTLMIVEGKEYSVQEFEKFAKLTNHENGDINKVMTEEETMTMLDNFLLQKIYMEAAIKHNIVLESGDTQNIPSDYDKDASVYVAANISKEDYIKIKTDNALVDKLKYNLDDYYTLPNEIYDQLVENFKNEGMYKTYSYRLMNIMYDEPKSGDESGDVVEILEEGLSSGDTESGDVEDRTRETKLAIANSVLEKIKSGDSFEELAKEHGSTRLSFVGNDLQMLNGEIEYATIPLLQSKLNSENLYNIVLDMKSGDITDVIEDEESNTFQIVKVESIEEGFVGEGEKELKSVLINEYANDIVSANMHYDMNEAGYIRALYKK